MPKEKKADFRRNFSCPTVNEPMKTFVTAEWTETEKEMLGSQCLQISVGYSLCQNDSE